jgi:hypothetical protein
MRNSLLVFFAFPFSFVFASGENYTIGAKQAGMANASVTQQDVFAIGYNPAGIGYLENPSVGLFADQRFLTGIHFYNLSAAMPVQKVGAFGISYDYFGFSAYNENRLGFAYARKFSDIISAGLKFNYFRLAIEENGAAHAGAFEAGVQIAPTKKMRVGAHVFNPIRQKISKEFSETLTTMIKVGVSYHPSEKLMFALETEKHINHAFRIKTGMEYKVIEPLYLRIGAATNPTLFTFGIGTVFKNLQIDFASSWHLQLGYSPQLAFIYNFNSKKSE